MEFTSDAVVVKHEADDRCQETECDDADTAQLFEIKTEADSNDIAEHPHDDKSRPYVCTVCDKRFTHGDSLKHHSQIHSGLHCVFDCGGVMQDDVYSCTQCGKLYSSESNLFRHMNVHTSKYKCTECGKCCHSGSELAVHRRSHSGEKPFECTVCGKRFTRSSDLACHSRIHSGEKPYKCHVCDMAFSESRQLKRHLLKSHNGSRMTFARRN